MPHIGESSYSSRGNKKDSDEREKKRASLEEKKEKKHEEILKIEANIFQLANNYFVFQGVILTAILRDDSTTLKCKYIGVPISLSFIAVVLNLFALCIMADKYKDSLKQLGTVSEELHVHMQKGLEARLKAQAQQVQLERAKQEAVVELKIIKDAHKKKERQRNIIWISSMILLILFALINILGTILIPCEL